jgi:hypothetical protein
MLMPASQASKTALLFLYVSLAGVGSIQLFVLFLEQYAVARFWEHWVVKYPIAGTYVPFCIIALASGALVGSVVGILTRARALVIAAWAGLGVCLLSFLTAAVAGGVDWAMANVALIAPPLIAAGLVLGALLGRKLRHA